MIGVSRHLVSRQTYHCSLSAAINFESNSRTIMYRVINLTGNSLSVGNTFRNAQHTAVSQTLKRVSSYSDHPV